MLPGPDWYESCPSGRDDGESTDDDYMCEFGQDDADAVYQDWLQTLGRDDLKMMALMLHDNYKARFGLTNSGVAAEVALLLGCNEKTVRLWRTSLSTKESFWSTNGDLMDDTLWTIVSLPWNEFEQTRLQRDVQI